MNDRELLELAAKAAGMPLGGWEPCAGGFFTYSHRGSDERKTWLPLTDDGDALRLAVKLALNIDIQHHETEVFTWDGVYLASEHVSVHPAHAYEATRRAIVTAAAKLGKES